ncbi:hypothetical protein [Sinomicrobium weinanense]|uniref:hypothetical protein n=1 Tax=Sinomicrobium weinanense TaxID=2842200 RepID=UPI00165D098C|nr:hypothetical protein [Sinomicrobium weinanense]
MEKYIHIGGMNPETVLPVYNDIIFCDAIKLVIYFSIPLIFINDAENMVIFERIGSTYKRRISSNPT